MKQDLPMEQYYPSLPKKRVTSAAIFRNQSGDILILHKDYGNCGWNLPGGVVEADESPLAAIIRETREEISLEKSGFRFLNIDYRPAQNEIVSESIQFLFDGGILSSQDIEAIRLSDEHSEFCFLPFEQALMRLSPFLAKRLRAVLGDNGALYLEDSAIVG